MENDETYPKKCNFFPVICSNGRNKSFDPRRYEKKCMLTKTEVVWSELQKHQNTHLRDP